MKFPSLSRPGGGSDRTMKSITLTKAADHWGKLPVGATFTWTYTTANPDQALTRTRAAFERAARLDPGYKGENLLDWRVVT